jgi:glycerol-3-phosphate dehydrogenase (NAD(P)+)
MSIKVGVLGGGAWGTAIAMACARAVSNVLLYAREQEVVDDVNKNHKNTMFLDGYELSKNITATGNIADMADAKVLFVVSPAQFFRAQCQALKAANIDTKIPVVICCKGIENGSLKMMSEVAEETIENPIVIMSGPTFADEVADGLPTSINISSKNDALSELVALAIESDSMKVSFNRDVIGSQIGGAVKNVIAIACGMMKGLGGGENAKAAIITRGLQEIYFINKAKGGNLRTIADLCAVGDLVLTCSSEKSRNFSFGMAVGQGGSIDDLLGNRKTVVEGVATAKSLNDLGAQLGLDLPVSKMVFDIVHNKANPKKLFEVL